jgi:hypothetical protein
MTRPKIGALAGPLENPALPQYCEELLPAETDSRLLALLARR